MSLDKLEQIIASLSLEIINCNDYMSFDYMRCMKVPELMMLISREFPKEFFSYKNSSGETPIESIVNKEYKDQFNGYNISYTYIEDFIVKSSGDILVKDIIKYFSLYGRYNHILDAFVYTIKTEDIEKHPIDLYQLLHLYDYITSEDLDILRDLFKKIPDTQIIKFKCDKRYPKVDSDIKEIVKELGK